MDMKDGDLCVFSLDRGERDSVLAGLAVMALSNPAKRDHYAAIADRLQGLEEFEDAKHHFIRGLVPGKPALPRHVDDGSSTYPGPGRDGH